MEVEVLMRNVLPIIVLFLVICLVFASDKIPVPTESADYSQKYVKKDTDTGDEYVCDQLVMVFIEDITREQQDKILKGINGKIIGGIPSMDMYQIAISNPSISLDHVNKLCQDLEKKKEIVHASPRKLPSGNINKIDMSKTKMVKRRGNLDLAPAERAAPEEEDEIVTTLSNYKSQLYSCLKNNKNVHGTIEYRITINPAGQVSDLKVLNSSLEDKILLDCFAYQIRKWDDFPEHTKQYDRQLDFSFKF